MSALALLGVAIPAAHGAADPGAAGAGSAAALFQPAAVMGVGAPVRTVDVADVTGDGRDDVILLTSYSSSGSENGEKLFVFAQQPDGTLAAPVRYATDVRPLSFFTVLDTNGDGRQDVAIDVVGGINVLRQTASGTLESAGLIPGKGIPVAADMDGDGDSDLVTGGSAGIFLVTQGAGGTFTSTTISTDNVAEVEVGDLDGDGTSEVVGAPSPSVNSTRLAVYRATATGWARTNHPTGVSAPESVNGVEVADVSGDGRADIIATLGGNKPRSQVSVLVQTADGALATGVLHPVWDIPQPVEAADITGDSRPDVVTVHGGWSALSVLPQSSGGGLDAPIRIQGLPYASNYTVHGLALGDINGDTATDVVIADYNSGLVVLRNNGR